MTAKQDEPAKGLKVDGYAYELLNTLTGASDTTMSAKLPDLKKYERLLSARALTDHATAERQIAELREQREWARDGWDAAIREGAENTRQIVKWSAFASTLEAENKGLRELLADVHDHAGKMVGAVLDGDKRELLILADAINRRHPARHQALAKDTPQ